MNSGWLSFLASLFFSILKYCPYFLGALLNSVSLVCRLCFVMCVWSLAISSSLMWIGGLALHRFVFVDVMVFCAGWMSDTLIPL